MFKSALSKILLTILSGIFICLAYFFFRYFSAPGYFPGYEDESIYFNSARLFFETGTLKGESCINEQFSVLLSANWYGIFYNLFYGTLAKAIGFHSGIFVGLNFVLLACCIILILRMPLDVENKLSAIISFLALDVVFSHLFTFYPETLNILFGIILTFAIIRMYESKDESTLKKWKLIFIISVVLFSLFRITWSFWMIGILPFAKTGKQRVYSSLIIAGTLLIAIVYEQLFCAPPLVGGGVILSELRNWNFVGFIRELLINLVRNLYYFFILNFKAAWSWIFIKFMLCVFVVHQMYALIKVKNTLLLAAAFIFLFNMFFLFCMYFAVYPYIMKITASLFIMYSLVIIYLDEKRLRNILLLCVCISFPAVVMNARQTVNERISSYQNANGAYLQSVNELKSIVNYLDPNKEALILCLDYEFRNTLPESIFAASLPLATMEKLPVRYTYTLFDKNIPYEQNFRTFNRLSPDYILSANQLSREDVKLLYQSHFFYFYKKV